MIDPTMFAADRPDHHCGCSPYLCRVCNPVRTRFAVIRDYAAAHGLSARQVEALVAELPGGGSNVFNMKDYRK